MAFLRLRSIPTYSLPSARVRTINPSSFISMHRCDHLLPGAAQQSRRALFGVGANTRLVISEGKFCIKREEGSSCKGGRSTTCQEGRSK